MLFKTPTLTDAEVSVHKEIDQLREKLSYSVGPCSPPATDWSVGGRRDPKRDRQRLGKRQRERVPVIGRVHPAGLHVLLRFQHDLILLIVAVPRTA